jgi:peptidoglycan hydrolase-like protein with peptidoglycan-binding domain
MASPPPNARRCRLITEGTQGVDVVAVKRALSRAGYVRWGSFTPVWGEFAVKAAKKFQQDQGIAPVTGLYGPKTHRALVKKRRKGSATELGRTAMIG